MNSTSAQEEFLSVSGDSAARAPGARLGSGAHGADLGKSGKVSDGD